MSNITYVCVDHMHCPWDLVLESFEMMMGTGNICLKSPTFVLWKFLSTLFMRLFNLYSLPK